MKTSFYINLVLSLLIIAGCKDSENTIEPIRLAPIISDVSPNKGKSGTEVTITGMNFGATPEENMVTFNGKEAVVIGAGETELTVKVPVEAGSGPVNLTVAGQTVEGPVFTWLPDNTRFVHTAGSDSENNCFEANNPCATIAHALDTADPGDLIDISAGIYTEMLSINKSISLQGAGQDTLTGTIIQAHPNFGMASDRVIYVVDGGHTVSINGLTIRHGKALGGGESGRGGGIRVLGSTIVLTEVTLYDNIATYGGAIHNSDASGTYTNVNFVDNIAVRGSADNQGTGGGVYNFRSSPTLQNVAFRRNKADRRGGGMRNIESAPILLNVTFDEDSAKFGGGMYNSSGSAPQLNGVTFKATQADSLGGGMLNNDSSPALDNVVFEANSAHHGGGMFNLNGSNPTLLNVQFTGNVASGEGGGMHSRDGSSLVLNGVVFTGNRAKFSGGGMSNIGTSSALLQDVIFEANKAEGGGGMYLAKARNTTLTDVIFVDNDGRCTDCQGGGMDSFGSSPVLTRVTFEANRAETGGGMAIRTGSPSLNHVEFVGNFAEEGGSSDPGNAGGLYNYQAYSMLKNVTFRNNIAAHIGGGMVDDAPGGESASLINTMFVGNSAGGGGGAMACLNESIALLTNITISDNSTEGFGGGLAIDDFATPILSNAIVWGNSASLSGNEIFVTNDAKVTLSFSLFANGDVDGDGTFTANNSFSADPLFVNTESGDLRLMNSSPAIDAGDPDTDLDLFPGGNNDPTDLDDDPRVVNGRIDIGAYENQGN